MLILSHENLELLMLYNVNVIPRMLVLMLYIKSLEAPNTIMQMWELYLQTGILPVKLKI